MPEHVHLLVGADRTRKWVERAKGRFARTEIQHWRRTQDPRLELVWHERSAQARFWLAGGGLRRRVEGRDDLCRVLDYIHSNPVRRGIVSAEEEYEWSSARSYGGQDSGGLVDLIDEDW